MTTEYTVLIGPHDVEQGPLPGGNVGALYLMELNTRNGNRIVLMVHETQGSPESAAVIEDLRAHSRDLIYARGESGWTNRRAIIPGRDRHGVGNAIEVSVPDGEGQRTAGRRERPT